MATIARHFMEHIQSLRAEIEKLRNCYISEFAGDLPRIQKKANVGWRNSGRDLEWLLLHIVGNEPVVFFCAEFQKVAPGVNRRPPQKQAIFFGRFRAGELRRPVEP